RTGERSKLERGLPHRVPHRSVDLIGAQHHYLARNRALFERWRLLESLDLADHLDPVAPGEKVGVRIYVIEIWLVVVLITVLKQVPLEPTLRVVFSMFAVRHVVRLATARPSLSVLDNQHGVVTVGPRGDHAQRPVGTERDRVAGAPGRHGSRERRRLGG